MTPPPIARRGVLISHWLYLNNLSEQSHTNRRFIPRLRMLKQYGVFLSFAINRMKFAQVVLAIWFGLVAVISGQIISPCVTDCIILLCPNGVTDTMCFCHAQSANIQTCLKGHCDAGSLVNAQLQVSNFCGILSLL